MREGWKLRPIQEVADQRLGKMLDKAKNLGTAKPYLRNMNVRWFDFDLTDLLEMRFEDEERERYTVKKGDVLICEGGYPGRAAVWPFDEPFYFQKAIHRVRFHEPERAKWLVYYLYLCDMDGSLQHHFTGTGIQHFTGEALKRFRIPLPPLSEQQRIVAILDEVFAGLATATANAEKNLRNARALFDSFLYSHFAKSDEGWPQRPLGSLCENLDSRRVPITKKDRLPGDIPYYGASGIVDYVSTHIFDEDLLLVSEDGANLLARTYPIAFSVTGKCWVNNHAHVLRFPDVVSQKFVELFLNSISLAPYVSGMAQPKLNQRLLNSILVPIPSLAVQKLVVSDLEKCSTDTEQLAKKYRKKMAAIAELKRSILQKAFSGELTSISASIVNEAAE